MKLTPQAWLRLLIIVVFVAFAALVIVHYGQLGDRDVLTASVNSADSNVTLLAARRAALESEAARSAERVSQTSENVKAAAGRLPSALESIEYGESLFALAETWKLKLTDVTATAPAAKAEGSVSYLTATYQANLSGSVDNVAGFVRSLTQIEAFNGVSVNSLTVTDVSGGATKMSISLTSYGFQGK